MMSQREGIPAAVVITPASPRSSIERPTSPQETIPTGVYSVQQPAANRAPPKPRRPTPAHTTSLSTQRTHLNGFSQRVRPTPLNEVAEEEGSTDDYQETASDSDQPLQMSTAAQAAALSAFLSMSNSDSDETETQTRITGVYREPLDLEGLEELVLGILRTGKLKIQGEPGDMTKIQPAMFALQANEKDLPQLLPQLMQSPFYYQDEQVDESEAYLPTCAEDLILNGHVRIGLPIDTAIYMMLKSHSAKTAKQAEAIITTLMSNNYIPAGSFAILPQMPPMIFQSNMSKSQRHRFRHDLKRSNGASTNLSIDASTCKMSDSNNVSGSSISSFSTTASESSKMSVSSISTSSGSLQDQLSAVADINQESRDTFVDNDQTEKLPESFPAKAKRKTSKVHTRPLRIRSSSSEFSDDEGIRSISERRLIPDQSTWNTSIVDNNMVVSQYGDTSYPLLIWNPKLNIEFQVKSSIGLLCGTVTGVDPSKPVVTVKLFNNTSNRVAFSIRSFRQSTIFTSHVVYPTKGLHVLDSDQCWEDNVELYPMIKGKSEIFVIDLLVCKLDERPSWNVLRKYAAMRGVKSETKTHLNARRLSKKRTSLFYMPGSKEQKEDNMKVIISHGLQCVVKGKLEEAEVIFTHALLLPDFQRIQLRAFVYICLAVVANKRQNKGHYDSLLPVLNEVSAASQLVDAVESTPGTPRMPRMMQLVKQLRKELDVHKIFIEYRQKTDGRPKDHKLEAPQWKESEEITLAGGTLSCNATTVHIPENAVKQDTRITLSTPDMTQLDTMLRTTGWDKTVKIVTAVNLSCSPITENFNSPLEITAILSEDASPNMQCLRLVHSNYLRHWQDITDDQFSSVEITGDKVLITTDRSGWLAVTSVQFDPSAIILKAMRSLSVEPIMLRFCVYGLNVPDTQLLQIAIFIAPSITEEEKPQHHVPIAFPHTLQAYPGERLQLKIQGQLEPETSMNEKDLNYEFDVQQIHTSICQKWLRMMSSPGTPLSGNVTVSSCRNSLGDWDSIAEIRLSSKAGFSTSKDSSKSASSGSKA